MDKKLARTILHDFINYNNVDTICSLIVVSYAICYGRLPTDEEMSKYLKMLKKELPNDS